MEAEAKTNLQPIIAKGDHHTLKIIPANLGLRGVLYNGSDKPLDEFNIGMVDLLPYVQGQTNIISAKTDRYHLDIWRDWLRLKAKLSTADDKVVDTFELKISDIFTQLGIDLKDVIAGHVQMPSLLKAVIGFIK